MLTMVAPQGFLTNVSIEFVGKTMLINIEVVNTHLDYNLLLGRSYIYAHFFNHLPALDVPLGWEYCYH